MKQPYIIGIGGGSGSGKTTLANDLKAQRPTETLLLHLDDYALPREQLPTLDGQTNFDHPEAINFAKLTSDLHALRAGKQVTATIRVPRDRQPEDPPRQRVSVTHEPAPVIIVEGFLLLHDPQLRDELDTTIFLKSDISQTGKRRANQAENEAWYLEHVVKPMHQQFVAPSVKHAKVVINVTGKNPAEVLGEVLSHVPPLS